MVLTLIENWKALTFHRESVIPPPQRLFIDRFATITLRPWQTRAHCCKHIVAHDVSRARKGAGHKMNVVLPCCANWETFVAGKMFLNKIRNTFCVQHTKFVSATHTARAGKRGNICVGNSVSATMCPRLPGSLSNSFIVRARTRPLNYLPLQLMRH